jgi:SagB-type dehydrogenase family enzyme
MHVHLRFRPSGRQRAAAVIGDQPDAIVEALAALDAGESDEAALNARVLDRGGVESILRWHHVLGICREHNLLDYAAHVNGRWVATIEPLAPAVEMPQIGDGAPAPSRLSRFAYVRREGGRTLLESPLAPVRLELAPESVPIALDGPATAGDAGARAVLTLLQRFGFHDPLDHTEPPARRVWEFHDALFHHASRLGGAKAGATCRWRDEMPPWPALKTGGASSRIALARPDLDAIARDDAPFTTVLEGRRSIRSAGAPLTIDQLSEFLFRAFRICAVDRASAVETIRRVVPAGGGLHELEAYVAVRQCTGLDPGSYWYDAHAHALEPIGAAEDTVSAFVDQAARSWGRRHPAPDVLITLAARLPRVAWTYERMAYRVVLMNVGAVMQTMYLVATAMALAPCAVGNGSPDLFATLTGIDPFDETSVGEFALSGGAAP